MARPVLSLVLAVGFMLALAVPILDWSTGQAGISTLPDRFASKQGYLALNEEFPGETTEPVEVIVDGDVTAPDVRRAVERLAADMEAEEELGPAEIEFEDDARLAVVTAPVAGDPLGEEAMAAVERLRADLIPAAFAGVEADALVTGDSAEIVDYVDLTAYWQPIVFAFVLGLSFILLTVAFRSVVVPATTILLNLLSVGAAYGLLVLVFQQGVGNELFGFRRWTRSRRGSRSSSSAVLFGLSMDYQVFLLSRIRERYNATGDTNEAIAFGVGSTARIITGAALIIIAVFAGFARGDLVMFQQMGFGIAVALFLDATIVRSVLVPASMTLLGRWNWYLPGWLAWLPDVHVEETEPREPAPAGR